MHLKFNSFEQMKTLFTFLFLIFHQFLIGATYYVSKDPCASNANDGLYANCDQGGIHGPFSTIQHAADVASAGDTVFIRGGTYDEKIDLLNYGTAGSPIVFMNYQNESPVIDWSGIDVKTTVLPKTEIRFAA
jgi:hypothetical protein